MQAVARAKDKIKKFRRKTLSGNSASAFPESNFHYIILEAVTYQFL